MNKICLLLLACMCLFSCKESKEKALFRLLENEKTGLDFVNQLKPNGELNIFRYMYFYNGGGVGSGDFNNDGLLDLFFSSNQGSSELYLNKGEMEFAKVTTQAGIISNNGWSTGVSIVDINQDGMLDIYVSQVGEFEVLKGKNLLYECQSIDANGIPHYEEKASEYGLDLVGFGTQAAFLDFDVDGDLDFFQLNHSVHQNGTFGKRENYLGEKHPLAGDRFFENINGRYIEKTDDVGIYRNALGYGLGLSIGDVNLDGLPDMYIGNDFHENDYLYINQGNKTFKDELAARIKHTSRFSMGVDIADINNDIFPEIVTLDMLPYDSEILKRSEGEDAYYNFEFKLKQGYNYQFARNNLQLNNGDGTFSEIGMYANIFATDWSWSSLFLDFDNDGLKDLFISNGINKRMNDTDYINFVSSDEIQQKIAQKRFDESDESLVDLIPEIKIPNKFFRNKGNLKFEDLEKVIESNRDSFSNGAIAVDLDNDGDLDIVTNNINDPAFIYENTSNTLYPENKTLKVHLNGSELNKNAIGAKVISFEKGKKTYVEKFPVRGFQSSCETDLLFAFQSQVDSLWVVWPDNSFEILKDGFQGKTLTIDYKSGLPQFNYGQLKNTQNQELEEVSNQFFEKEIKHFENEFNEFDREALIPNKLSTAGPGLAVGDLNADGLDDFFIGSGRKLKSQVFVQNKNGGFMEQKLPMLAADSLYEDVDAVIFDANNDGLNDLFVLSAGNEYLNTSEFNSGRLYIQDSNGNLIRKNFPKTITTLNCVRSADFDNDGDIDLFLGSETLPWSYGKIPDSFLMVNNGKGTFSPTNQPIFSKLGMVKDAQWVDYDQDGDKDLIVALEWDYIYVLENSNGQFSKKALTDKKGLWNFIQTVDLDEDGDVDFVIGNHSQNSRFQIQNEESIKMYVNDFDKNGRLDQIITYPLEGKETIFADKKEIEKQLPYVRKKYNLSKDFAKAEITDIFGSDEFEKSAKFSVDFLQNAVLWNKGKDGFKLEAFPDNFQYAQYHAGTSLGNGQVILMGNFYDANIQLGRYDADKGSLLTFRNGSFQKSMLNIEGQVRAIKEIKIQGSKYYLVGRNNEKLLLLQRKP